MSILAVRLAADTGGDAVPDDRVLRAKIDYLEALLADERRYLNRARAEARRLAEELDFRDEKIRVLTRVIERMNGSAR